jgi:hypothetical protein
MTSIFATTRMDRKLAGLVFLGRELLYRAKPGKVTIRKKASPEFGAYQVDRPVRTVGQFFNRGEGRMRFSATGPREAQTMHC